MKSEKIALIIPYFGKWPIYIHLYFASLAKNPMVDLLIFSDIPDEISVLPNVKIIRFSLQEFGKLATQKLGIPIKVTRAYKLCDFRPAYGLIFEDYLLDYPYWAYGDLDLVYGDIRRVLPDDWTSYDALSMRNEWMTGSFSILRNTLKMNELFKRSATWVDTLNAEKYLGFDECGKKFGPLFESDEKFFLEDKLQSLTYLVKKAHQNNEIRAQFLRRIKESIPKGDHVHYNRGTLVQKDGKELQLPKMEIRSGRILHHRLRLLHTRGIPFI